MRVRRLFPGLAVLLVAALTGGGALVAASPAPAGPTDSQMLYWKIGKAGVKGLVTAEQVGTSVSVAWHLWGLKPDHDYALGAFDSTCAQPAGAPVFERSFTTNRRGISWDPVDVAASIGDIASLQLRDLEAGANVWCSGSATGGSSVAEALKIDRSGLKGLVVIDENSTRRVIMTLSGLRPSTRHRLMGRSSGCGSAGQPRFSYGFDSTSKGRALLDRITTEPITAGFTSVGSVRVKRGTTLLACAVPTIS